MILPLIAPKVSRSIALLGCILVIAAASYFIFAHPARGQVAESIRCG